MSINNVGTSSFSNACLTPEAQIAVLLLENEQQQQQIDQDGLSAARHDFIEHSKAEVAAMHDEADDIARGAWFEAGVTVGGAVIQGIATYNEADKSLTSKAASAAWGNVRATAASTSGGLASAGGKMLGDSPAADDRAEAKQLATAAKQDEWEIDDRKNAIHQSQADQQRASDWIAQLIDKDAASATAVLSNMA